MINTEKGMEKKRVAEKGMCEHCILRFLAILSTRMRASAFSSL
jgi:hypothetical protein